MYKWYKQTKQLPLSSLWKELPDFTCDHMQQIFGHGAGMKTQRKEDYSKSLVIVNEKTDEIFCLYMRCGEWRIGGTESRINHLHGRALRKYFGYRSRDVEQFENWLREKAGLKSS